MVDTPRTYKSLAKGVVKALQGEGVITVVIIYEHQVQSLYIHSQDRNYVIFCR